MKRMWVWAALGCLVTASPVWADDGEVLTPDQLPPAVMREIREGFNAEPLFARKEVEGGKECYVVTAKLNDQVIELYASPDGHALVRKTEEFTLARWAERLPGAALSLLVLGMAPGAVARGVVRTAKGLPLAVWEGWLAAWAAAAVVPGLVVFSMNTVPREKDVPVLLAFCAVFGAIAASVVEGVVLAVRPGQRDRAARRRGVLGCCAVAAVSLALTIPLEILLVEWDNRIGKKLTLRVPAD